MSDYWYDGGRWDLSYAIQKSMAKLYQACARLY